ncbi:hypothetical protein BURPS1106B_1154 [Burkholderia pseudomallei 1106b]|uniref:Uncharacterized protein n=2 Tax=Burkholderia pseudomallei TaxID=28450 RepID=A0A0E1VWD5_BURPE|nr:hypothetical protein BURPS1106A_A0832 [Burkholderia pseudomallei 1106a]EES21545.1 hypothetical protein BURPS1106B_1154 [Burkholderia pseudomallei 1106b]EET05223.1 hypothetical protein BURPS1710A_A3335 [Burkholderia pseudomallei 1710a]
MLVVRQPVCRSVRGRGGRWRPPRRGRRPRGGAPECFRLE